MPSQDSSNDNQVEKHKMKGLIKSSFKLNKQGRIREILNKKYNLFKSPSKESERSAHSGSPTPSLNFNEGPREPSSSFKLAREALGFASHNPDSEQDDDSFFEQRR